MVNACVVNGCNFCYSRRERQGKQHVSLHAFPSSGERKEKWIRAIKRENWNPTASSHVCSQHFRPEDMDLTGQTRRLREGAIPSIFPSYPSCLQRRTLSHKPPSRKITLSGDTRLQNNYNISSPSSGFDAIQYIITQAKQEAQKEPEAAKAVQNPSTVLHVGALSSLSSSEANSPAKVQPTTSYKLIEKEPEIKEDYETQIGVSLIILKQKKDSRFVSEFKNAPPKKNHGDQVSTHLSSSDDEDEYFPVKRSRTTHRNQLISESNASNISCSSGTSGNRFTVSHVADRKDRRQELRDRNNEASRRSRLNRRAREVEMYRELMKLQEENPTLRIRADELEKLIVKLRLLLDNFSSSSFYAIQYIIAKAEQIAREQPEAAKAVQIPSSDLQIDALCSLSSSEASNPVTLEPTNLFRVIEDEIEEVEKCKVKEEYKTPQMGATALFKVIKDEIEEVGKCKVKEEYKTSQMGANVPVKMEPTIIFKVIEDETENVEVCKVKEECETPQTAANVPVKMEPTIIFKVIEGETKNVEVNERANIPVQVESITLSKVETENVETWKTKEQYETPQMDLNLMIKQKKDSSFILEIKNVTPKKIQGKQASTHMSSPSNKSDGYDEQYFQTIRSRTTHRKLLKSASSIPSSMRAPGTSLSRSSVSYADKERYRKMRDKNNELSRRSRLIRKAREVQMQEQLVKLQQENQTMHLRADELEKLLVKLRILLLKFVH